MTKTFDCPSCGAPIEYGGGKSSMQCPFCGSAVTVPQSAGSGMPGDKMQGIKALAASGNKIEAIKAYRQMTGVGLAEAKAAVEALEVGHPVVNSQVSGAALGGLLGDVALMKEVKNQLLQGNKIEAIKAYRKMTGVGLAEAKEAVDALEAGQPVVISQTTTVDGVVMAGAGFAGSAEAMDAIKAELRGGNKIKAIQIHRTYFGTNLADSKTAVEQMEGDLKFQSPSVLDTEPPAFARPEAAPVGPTISPNPFDESQPPAWRKWLVGCGIGAVVFLCLCVGLPLLLVMAGLLKLGN